MTESDRIALQVSSSAGSHALLNPEQRVECERLATLDTLDGRRAEALLAIDSGSTHVEAGHQSGLTPGQVKYCLSRFRQVGVEMFVSTQPGSIQPESREVSTSVSEPEGVMDADLEDEVGAETGVITEEPVKGKAGKGKDKKTKKGVEMEEKPSGTKRGKSAKKKAKTKGGKKKKATNKKKGKTKGKKKGKKKGTT